jgi:hypothetical protein
VDAEPRGRHVGDRRVADDGEQRPVAGELNEVARFAPIPVREKAAEPEERHGGCSEEQRFQERARDDDVAEL